MKTRAFLVAVAFVGAGAIASGLWIHVKAALAQILLRAAWQRTLDGETDARPWPWADTRPMARILVERSGDDFVVLEGANGRALAFAPAHLEHSAMPGDDGNCVITAHRDTHFAALRDVIVGDVIRVQRSDGRWFVYRIEQQRVVDKRDVWVMRSVGEAVLTLVTCYPFDAIVPGGPQRYVLTGVLEPLARPSATLSPLSRGEGQTGLLPAWRGEGARSADEGSS